MNEQNMRFRIGVFALTSVILFAILIMLFGGMPTYFLPQDQYTVVFDEATGVDKGTPVRRSGVRIGQVVAINLDDATGKVRVTIHIDHPHHLYQDDQPTLVHGALTGDTTIDLLPRVPPTPPNQAGESRSGLIPVVFPVAQVLPGGQQPPEPVARPLAKPGSEFIGTSRADVPLLLDKLASITPPALEALAELRKTMKRLDEMSPLIEDTIRTYRNLGEKANAMDLKKTNDDLQVAINYWTQVGERTNLFLRTNEDKMNKVVDSITNILSEKNQRNFDTTLKNVAAASENLDAISKNADTLLKSGQQTLTGINRTLGNTDELLNTIQQVAKPFAERSAGTARNLDESVERLNRSLADLQELLRALNQSDGVFRRLVSDPALYNNLNELTSGLVRAMPRIDQILKDMEVFADKIARHPESLGVRGAVVPNSGLKESPFRSQYP
jgi:phospholipid/cholesterol/gamma-HCH transport system substrate-binding protein